MVQDSIAFNEKKGTLRGLHYHAAPFPQARVIRCAAGAAFVAVADLRPDSPTFLRTYEAMLDGRSQSAIYVPAGMALGYQTMADETMILLQDAGVLRPAVRAGRALERSGLQHRVARRHPTINARDASYPDFKS